MHKRKCENMLKELREKYPKNSYKISSKGNVVRKYGTEWFGVCIHNIRKVMCKEEQCEGGSSLCIHKIPRSHCSVESCGGGKSLCIHKRLKSACLDLGCNGGNAMCKHNKQKSICSDPICGGGGGLCTHGKPRTRCKEDECEGGGSICLHGINKAKCRATECNGGSSFCPCGQRKEYCQEHGGSGLCIKCKTHAKKVDDLCVSCHPNYIPTVKNASKIGCEYICRLQAYIGGGLKIQHIHYDNISKSVTGNEFQLPEYKTKKVDGFYTNSKGQRIIIEFLGDVYHGHPSKWGDDEQGVDFFGRLHKNNFYNTERKFVKITSFGYIIHYVWESEYKKLKVLQSPQSILREFNGKLEY